MASALGVLLSLLLGLIMTVYGLQQFQVLLSKQGNDLMQTELKYYYGDDETLTGEDGLNFAFTLTSSSGYQLEDRYGSFYLYEMEWYLDDEGEYVYTNKEIGFHHCESGELEKRFYPVIEA